MYIAASSPSQISSSPSCLFPVYVSSPLDQVRTSFVDQHCIEDIHECFVDQKSLEQQSGDGRAFSEHKEGAIDPGEGEGMEDGEEEDLGNVGPEEQRKENEQREEQAREEACAKERIQEGMSQKIIDSLFQKHG
ncbi:MAG: hypothetical protein Q9195_003333 [Heterodermia aff. obscurata]